MLGFIKELCQKLSGSQLSMPRWSKWSMVAPGQASIGIDVADVATGGAAAVAPVNVKAYGSHFATGLVSDDSDLSIEVSGFGGGGGVGAGWGIPFVGGKATGRMSAGVAKEIAERLGGAAQGKAIDMLKDATKLGISGGTRLVNGPDAPPGGMTPLEFRGFVTVITLGANFIIDGVSGGLVFFSNNRPVMNVSDMLHVTAVGLMGAVGIAASLDVEANGMVYKVDMTNTAVCKA